MLFEQIDKFFSSIQNFWTFNEILIVFVGVFLFTVFCIAISTSHAYEARLIKAVDMLNGYFIDNPQINEDNLVQFNEKMKSRKVPKTLRKQWQQFVLYRENKASHYMSFETCVSTPIKNSTFKRDVVTMNIISYILAAASLILNLYISHESYIDLVLRHALLCPIIILLLNYVVTIFLDLRHNAIVSDLYQNYQYFEVNIDKATQTLPEYVDYEVLFDKNEIKRGIPILYAYLQKRAEEEQRELERARLKNVEHEKFNFDESGVESSLVLERAMQEAENYIAERKRYMEDMQKINNDISQEEANFREITKEYQRQMQVSKESFENYKAQLTEASSTIEANYLKKQQQQELDRQRNLERDYDTSTDRHKKLIENYQAEIKTIEEFIAKARRTLEKGMMSEFKSYSNKVYDKANEVVEDRHEEINNNLKKQIQQLEERLILKDAELQEIHNQHQSLSERFNEQENAYQQKLEENAKVLDRVSKEINNYNTKKGQPSYQESEYVAQEKPVDNYTDDSYAEQYDYDDNVNYGYEDNQVSQPEDNQDYDFNYAPENDYVDDNQDYDMSYEQDEDDSNGSQEFKFNYLDEDEDESAEKYDYLDELAEEKQSTEGEKVDAEISAIQKVESVAKKRPGRPKKVKVEETTPKRKVGRPKKVVETKLEEIKRKPGRPKKVEEPAKAESAIKKGRGRPRKEQPVQTVAHRGPGRPKKVEQTKAENNKRKVGRPKKIETTANVDATTKKGRGRPRKEQQPVQPAKHRGPGRPKKVAENTVSAVKRGRGRPKKNEIDDIDAYLKEIDNQIAKENAKLEKSTKALERKSKISKKK
ncbi:MAG: hypothetical protein IKM43_01000 [Clostridia bacterium]|nr:hypothetical protein [Clostridia bacterium]